MILFSKFKIYILGLFALGVISLISTSNASAELTERTRSFVRENRLRAIVDHNPSHRPIADMKIKIMSDVDLSKIGRGQTGFALSSGQILESANSEEVACQVYLKNRIGDLPEQKLGKRSLKVGSVKFGSIPWLFNSTLVPIPQNQPWRWEITFMIDGDDSVSSLECNVQRTSYYQFSDRPVIDVSLSRITNIFDTNGLCLFINGDLVRQSDVVREAVIQYFARNNSMEQSEFKVGLKEIDHHKWTYLIELNTENIFQVEMIIEPDTQSIMPYRIVGGQRN